VSQSRSGRGREEEIKLVIQSIAIHFTDCVIMAPKDYSHETKERRNREDGDMLHSLEKPKYIQFCLGV
jgi:hypothetical protein